MSTASIGELFDSVPLEEKSLEGACPLGGVPPGASPPPGAPEVDALASYGKVVFAKKVFRDSSTVCLT